MSLQISPRRILIEGSLINLITTIATYSILYLDPMLAIHSYPPDIQAAVGFTPNPFVIHVGVIEAIIIAAFLILALLSNAKLRGQNTQELSFLSAFTHTLTLLLFYALWDLLIIDWLLFLTLQPSFIIIPGTEGILGYHDFFFHLQVSFFNPLMWAAFLLASLIIATLTTLMIRHGFSFFMWWVRQPDTPPHETT